MLKKTKSTIKSNASLKYKIMLIVSFILFMDSGTTLNRINEDKFNNYESIIQEKNIEIQEKNIEIQDLKLKEQEYQDSLKRIVSNLYEEELFVEAGGASIDVDKYDINLIYEAIVNASLNFRTLMSDVEHYFDARKEYLDNIPSIWPIAYSDLARITDNYGWRIYPMTGTLHFHKGLDIAAASNSKVVATADGRVINHYLPPDGNRYKGDDIYGGMIEIDHGNGFVTLYGHLSKTYVSERIGATNNIVERGQVIGIVGNTGKSRGIHVHYEIKYNNKLVNPMDFLSSNRTVFMNEQIDLN